VEAADVSEELEALFVDFELPELDDDDDA